MNTQSKEKALWVFFDSNARGIAVELPIGPSGIAACPMPVMYAAHGVYDMSRSKVLKWKLPQTPMELMDTMQRLAENPTGRFLRGRSKLGRLLVTAIKGVPEDVSEKMGLWMRVALYSTDTMLVIPEHPQLLDQYFYHEDDQPIVDVLVGAPA